MNSTIVPAAVLMGLAGAALGQNSATINTQGMELRCQLFGPCFPNQTRNSSANPSPAGPAQFVLPSLGYSYDIQGTVTTTGLMGSIIPTGSTVQQMLDTLQAGQSNLTSGFVRNPEGTLPANIYIQRYEGTLAGLQLGITLKVRANSAGHAFFEITDIQIPLGALAGTLRLDSGSTVNVSRWTPSTPTPSEWHFNGSFEATEGPGQIRYLDDPAFGTILGGIDNENTPNPSAPHNITMQQSAFGTTTSFGIPGPGGAEDVVYKTSPARNLGNPDPDLRRGIGLIVYPATKPTYPGDIVGQWTAIWDVYIPAAAFAAEYPLCLLEDSDNNDSAGDLLIRRSGGVTSIGYGVDPSQFIAAPQIVADTWLRIAVANDHPRAAGAKVYVNGAYVGETAPDWLYNFCDPTAPTFGDATPIAPAAWSAWGAFPNPWAFSGGGTPISSTFSMFADLEGGRSESVFLANFLFMDRTMNASEISALGSPDARGILFFDGPQCSWQSGGCAADFDGDDDFDSDDVLAFFASWDSGDECADADADGDADSDDVVLFFNAWDNGGC